MKIAVFPIRPMQENAYLFYNEESADGVVIDPGGDAARLLRFIDENKLNIKAILLTHGHFDHIGGVPELREGLNAPVIAHRDEMIVLNDVKANMSHHMLRKRITIEPDILADDGYTFAFGRDDSLTFIHTPGHTPGSACFYSEKDKALFTGDTLFFESVGRTDFMFGDTQALFNAVKEKLFILPPDVLVYPGHGQSSSVGHERCNNPFF